MLFLISTELLTILTVVVRVEAIAISLSDSDTQQYYTTIQVFKSIHKFSPSYLQYIF